MFGFSFLSIGSIISTYVICRIYMGKGRGAYMVIAEHLVKEFLKSEKVRKKTIKSTFRAVDDVSLIAKDGETLGILGPNGAGKTTFLRMLGTLMEPTEGRVEHVLTDGTHLTRPEEIKARMGYLSNNTKLYEKFSVREFLGMLGEIYGMTREETQERTETVIKALSMEGFADNRIGKLSTGQTQRASIARCLFHDPDLYILDEPTLGLDIMSAAAIVDFMRAEKERGKTIIYSTHYLEEAQSLCDRVVLINKGKIIASDSPASLCKQTGTDSLREAFLALIGEDGEQA